MSPYSSNIAASGPRHKRRLIALIVLSAAVIILAIVYQKIMSSHANALWSIVRRCVIGSQANRNPAPCASVDSAEGFVIYKDLTGNTQYLILPTSKITGIESPAAWAPDAPNYFAQAWTATELIDQKLHRTLPRTDFALAINSISGRTQNQLHIHVDCIQPDDKSVLEHVSAGIGTSWQPLPVKLSGHQYRAMWLPGSMLGQRNPFQLLASSLTNPATEMGGHTLVLVGAERNGQDGFILLDGKAPDWAVTIAPLIKLGFGSGEELEDHSCRIANAS